MVWMSLHVMLKKYMYLYESCEKVWIKGRKDGCIESQGNGMWLLSEFNLKLKELMQWPELLNIIM